VTVQKRCFWCETELQDGKFCNDVCKQKYDKFWEDYGFFTHLMKEKKKADKNEGTTVQDSETP
jgi:hypothetical protein